MTNIVEIWKPIMGHENLYEVSNHGNVRNLKTRLIKKPNLNGKYNRVSLKCPIKLAHNHRLVATHFIPNPENKPEVNHKDGNKRNNHISNLEWCTRLENAQHACITGLQHKGSQIYNTELKEYQVIEIKKRISSGEKSSLICLDFGTSREVVNAIKWGRTWKHVVIETLIDQFKVG